MRKVRNRFDMSFSLMFLVVMLSENLFPKWMPTLMLVGMSITLFVHNIKYRELIWKPVLFALGVLLILAATWM